jgi:hypothetical protein
LSNGPIILDVRNLSTVVKASDLKQAFPALMQQANSDLRRYWESPAGWELWERPPLLGGCRELVCDQPWMDDPRYWRASIYDSPPQALSDPCAQGMPVQALQSLGYNYPDPLLRPAVSVPHLVVFAGSALQGGVAWTVTFSHELLESLTNPNGTSIVQVPSGDLYNLAVCDPVQYVSYPVGDVVVSDFVTPDWFGDPAADPTGLRFDFANTLVGPLRAALGGEWTRVGPRPNRVDPLPLPELAPTQWLRQWTTQQTARGTVASPPTC